VKRRFILAVWASALMGALMLVNCSDPHEGTTPADLTPTGPSDTLYVVDSIFVIDSTFVFDSTFTFDTVFVIDTIFNSDSIFVIDTTFVIDSIFVVDSIITIDTIIVVDPDGDGSQLVCSRIASNQQEIVWMFRNQEGLFNLAFVAALESDHPEPKLSVDIDGQTFPWSLVEDREWITNAHLGQNAMIRIAAEKPPAAGHAINVCLTVTRLQ